MEEALRDTRHPGRARRLSPWLLTALALLGAACSPSRETPAPELPRSDSPPENGAEDVPTAVAPEATAPELLGRWFHAREEDTQGQRVYRPAGYPLPPSRGRTGFELFADGRATLFAPGPSDRGESTPARWESVGPQTIRIVDADGTERFRIVVLEREPERLVTRIERP